jgi:alkaline phosphatase D
VRQHNSPEVTDLAGYRNRYALYKGDSNLRAAHAHCPWVVIWDDHEVQNNYAGAHSADPTVTAEAFLARRAAAYRAWWEHMPVRMDPPTGPDLEIRRDLRWGSLAHLFMLDTRQYRDPQACGVKGVSLEPACLAVYDESRTIVGADQEHWLLDGLRDSDTTWNVLGNQVVMTRLKLGEAILNYDQWDGYDASRRHLYQRLRDAGITNTVVVSGDLHLAAVGDLTDDHGVVATELVGTSISSVPDLPGAIDQLVTDTLHDVKYFDSTRRGWCHNVVTHATWTAEFRAVGDDTVDGSGTGTDAVFTITPDRPGATRTA